jgi:thiamine-phosphate pyrophosphorylase
LNFELPRIYPITDAGISGLSHSAQVERLIAGGARLIQLREKRSPSGDFYKSALAAARIAHDCGIRVVINDRVDIALAVKADGVHLGQDDLPPENARAILGDDAIIGFSTHSVEQARRAMSMPVDYIAIGPIFQTKTKESPVGLDGLRRVRDAIGDLPLVAIGGITIDNIGPVFDAGADCVAVIGALLSEPDAIAERMCEFHAFGR